MTKTIDQKALKFIDDNQLIDKGDKVLVALSGGADSVFLLYFLQKFKKRFGIELVAFHLNHNLRGKSASDDEKFCFDFCSKYKIKFISVSKDVKTYSKQMKISVEEAGRKIRYSELYKTKNKVGCTKIATAHNASDNVETMMLNFIKGAGVKGLSGIPIRRDDIIRPIICLTSEEIRKYLKQKKIRFRIDESNLNSDYERNFLRNEIIPKLKKRLNQRLEEKVLNTTKIISEISSILDAQIEKVKLTALKFYKNELGINLKVISKLDRSFLNVFIKSVLENNFDIELSSENIYDIVRLISSQTGSVVHLKGNLYVFREREELIIGRKYIGKSDSITVKIRIGQKAEIGNRIISISEVKRKLLMFTGDKSTEFISGDGLGEIFEIRTWRAGDKFEPIGMKGTKKISDFLADEKISSIRKNEQLVLTNKGKIVWVIGLRIDERFKITSDTKRIIKLEVSDK
jgi:tRNA(Ile)-lysidine synthase